MDLKIIIYDFDEDRTNDNRPCTTIRYRREENGVLIHPHPAPALERRIVFNSSTYQNHFRRNLERLLSHDQNQALVYLQTFPNLSEELQELIMRLREDYHD